LPPRFRHVPPPSAAAVDAPPSVPRVAALPAPAPPAIPKRDHEFELAAPPSYSISITLAAAFSRRIPESITLSTVFARVSVPSATHSQLRLLSVGPIGDTGGRAAATTVSPRVLVPAIPLGVLAHSEPQMEGHVVAARSERCSSLSFLQNT
ncbi:hypothetical protein GW17_00048593, partial [Ensete ventricosum]